MNVDGAKVDAITSWCRSDERREAPPAELHRAVGKDQSLTILELETHRKNQEFSAAGLESNEHLGFTALRPARQWPKSK